MLKSSFFFPLGSLVFTTSWSKCTLLHTFQRIYKHTHWSRVHISPFIKCTHPTETPPPLHRAPVSPHTETETEADGGGRSKSRLSVKWSALWQNITPYGSSFHSFFLSFISQEITFCHTHFSKRGGKQEGNCTVHPTLLSDDLITHLGRPSHQAQSRVPRGTHTGNCPQCLHSRLHGTAEGYAHTRRCLTVEEDTQ